MQNPSFFRSLAVYFILAWSLAVSTSSHAAIFSVTTTNDNATGCLRYAITNANATTPGANTITFSLTGTPPFTINVVGSALPTISNPLKIDGTSQSGYVNTPVVELNGAGAGSSASGLQLNAGSCTVLGLAINRFLANGIKVNSASNVIQGNFIGTDSSGTVARGNSGDGILVTSAGNLIGGTNAATRNIISGNGQAGILVSGIAATGNTIAGNYIGTDIIGTNALANSTNGIQIDLAPANVIGPSNLISGNKLIGVYISGTGANSNTVIGNFIGIDASGKFPLGNTYAGITIFNGNYNQIGGRNAGNGNVISGNVQDGIYLTNALQTVIQGNLIGLSAVGTNPIANGFNGITINGSSGNTIGGSASGARNFISGNAWNGVCIVQTYDSLNIVAGNYIGSDINGRRAVPNQLSGVRVEGCTNTIGGTKIGNGNIISGNTQRGVWLIGTNGNAEGNLVAGNLIGLDCTGTNSLGNGNAGIGITSAATNVIGGTSSAARNIISGNGTYGIFLIGNGTTGNVIQGNYIGTDTNGTLARGNFSDGIYLQSVTNNLIGGTNADSLTLDVGNLISGNNANGSGGGNNGIHLTNSSQITIQGNRIGTDVTGTLALGNSWNAIYMESSSSNQIGGITAGSGNLLSGNVRAGIYMTNCTAQVIQRNYIGTDVSGGNAIVNGYEGIDLENSTNNFIGGIGAGNVVSGNGSTTYPAAIMLHYATQNTLQGNLVGPNATGTAVVSNKFVGIYLWNSTSNRIGSAVVGTGNVVSGNGNDGMYFLNAPWNTIQGNFIGLATDGISPMGNIKQNVEFDNGSSNNILGGLTSGAGNSIAYAVTPLYSGVRVRTNAFNNLISGNSIHNNSNLGIDLGNLGVNPNIPGESGVSATNANRLQNYPVLSNAAVGTIAMLIRGSFDCVPGKTYSLEFFASPSGNTNGYGEGQVFLGQTNLNLTASPTNFSITLPGTVPTNWVVTATATDPANNTSEFSDWVTNVTKIPIPAAGLASYTRTAGLALMISLADLATNWSDAGGYPIRLAAINMTTTNRVNLIPANLTTNSDGSYGITNTAFLYYPNTSPNQSDQFSYTITDGYGTNTGLVNISVVGSVYGQIQGITVSNGVATAKFAGIPGWTYNVQRSTNLMNWVTRLTTNAPAGGLFQFIDTFSDLGGKAPAAAYYQLFWQP